MTRSRPAARAADATRTVAQWFALIFGAVYALVGVLGFLRPLTDAPANGLIVTETTDLLGLFAVNWFHNLLHLGTGVLGVLAWTRTDLARRYAQVVAVAFAGLFLIGLVTDNFLGILPLDTADNLLHLATALISGIIGFTAVGLRRAAA